MTETAVVFLWGVRVGAVSRRDSMPYVQFEYDPEFYAQGVEPAPLMMPVGRKVYSFPDLPDKSFHGLPGLLADSVPDKFGNAVIDVWLQSQGRVLGSMSPIERLCYTGTRGMGALEYRPSLMDDEDVDEQVQVEALAQLANEVLKERTEARTALVQGMIHYAPILRVGSSAGGARAKAIIGWNERTGEVRSGQVRLPPEFGYWLIKFDGLDGNGDKEDDDEWGYGRVEYAYSLMAKAAGIEMSECRLWNRRHFMTRRFDRMSSGGKLHMQTLGAMAHFDFNNPTSYSYEQAFRVVRQVVGDIRAERELFRRMVFNVLAWNCDDHVKNISFLMDRDGRWTLSPAYDECYAYKPESSWISRHQMSINGKRTGITDADMIAAGKVAGLSQRDCAALLDEVRAAVREWPRFASAAEVKDEFVAEIERQLHLDEGWHHGV